METTIWKVTIMVLIVHKNVHILIIISPIRVNVIDN